uniref:Reverse transcriptase Ty1/copia-type domain-containing protein n=1 Tax=Physcomitrium patens TaxID=3218 RepID=A0A2K1K1L6_PHYPA|nr:hypothetical protein PHYPA_012141 [Physcomitrium patens]
MESEYNSLIKNGTYKLHSMKQVMVVQSSIKVKYIVVATSLKELIWLQTLLKEIGQQITLSNIIYLYNQSCIVIIKKPRFHDCTKYIDIKYHYIRNKIKVNEVVLEFIHMNEMKGDIMTKLLPKSKHNHFIKDLININNSNKI